MSRCSFCNKEVKVTFICPYCKKPTCSDHRKPKDHNCSEYYSHENSKEIQVEQTLLQPIFSKLVDVKTPLVIIIIVTLVLGTLIGMNIGSNNTQTNLQQRYDALNEYYQDLQSQNQDINKELEDMNNEFNLLENQLYLTQQELSNLQKDWGKVFSDQTKNIKPTVNQLRTWLTSDQTDQQTITKEYTSLNQAIQLSMKAKTQGWKLGVITIYGNYTDNKNNHTYNIIKINDDSFEDALIFIDPQTDFIWWNTNYVPITPGQVFSLEEYQEVYITEIDVILEP